MTYPPQDPYQSQQQPYQPQSPAPYSPGPYPPSYQQQPAYAQPVYPQQVIVTQQAPASGSATASLILGILGVLGGWCLLGIPCVLAVIFGHVGLSQTRDGSRSGRGQAVAGLILGYVCVIPAVILFFSVFMGLMNATVTPDVTPTP